MKIPQKKMWFINNLLMAKPSEYGRFCFYTIREVVTVAKGKYQRWLEPDGLILLEGWARDGLTDEQIAGKIGISRSTLNDWKAKYPDISDTLKKGKEVVDFEVENALYQAAIKGNVTAQIYWLNNRKPERWRNKQKEENDTAALDKLDNILKEIKEDAKNAVHD